MRQIAPRRLRRLAAPLFVALAAAVVAPAGAQAAASACDRGDLLPSEVSAQQLDATTLCLINRERAARGLKALRADRRLARAAKRHSRDMVANRFFAHDSRSGARFSTRISRTGWMDGRRRWSVGENLAWGSGAKAAPRSIVRAWMDSPGHRANLLSGKFRLIGIGVARAVPVASSLQGATYTADFGS